MFKIFNRPEATVSTFEELVALKQFFDGKKHNLVFENTEIFYAFYKELFEKCKVNNFFENLIFDNNRKINVKNVPVDDVSDENKLVTEADLIKMKQEILKGIKSQADSLQSLLELAKIVGTIGGDDNAAQWLSRSRIFNIFKFIYKNRSNDVK